MSIYKTKILSLDNLPNSKDLLRATLKEIAYNPNNEKTSVIYKKNIDKSQYIFDKTLPENFFKSIDAEINGKNFEYINLDYIAVQSYQSSSTDASSQFYSLDYVINSDADRITYDSVLLAKSVNREMEINNFYRYLDFNTQDSLEVNIKKFLKNEKNSNIIIENPNTIEKEKLIQKNKIVFIKTSEVDNLDKINSTNKEFLPYYNKIVIPLRNIRKKNVNANGSSILTNLSNIQRDIANSNFLFIPSQTAGVINTTNIFSETTGSDSTDAFYSLNLSIPSGMNTTLFNQRNLSPFKYENKIDYFLNFVYVPPTSTPFFLNDFNSGPLSIYTTKKDSKDVVFNNLGTDFEVCYLKISKYFQNDKAPIQEIYLSLPSDTEKKFITYIDSQILSSKQYRYEVSIGVLSYGFRYVYKKFEENNKIVYQILTSQYPRLIELPYFTDFTNGIGTSLQIPDMQFITQTKNRNVIKIIFNSISATEMPIALTTADSEYFNNLKKTLDGKILFLSDNIDFYNLHILDKEPADIIDFVNNSKIDKIDVKNGITSIQKTFSTDKKYYFLAVSRSNDGKKVSNPSFAYKLEFVKTSAAEIPIITRYNFKNNQDKLSEIVLKEKNVKKLIKITPSIFQTLVSEKAGIDGTYGFSDFNIGTFGNLLENIWQQESDIDNNKLKFKIRVTSKTTGKKIDINLNFQKDIITKFQK